MSDPADDNSDDFIFDNQMLVRIIWHGYRIDEASCPMKYFDDASSVSVRRSVVYGFGVLKTALRFRFCKMGLRSSPLFR